MSTIPPKIDVHHHILPPEYISSLAKKGIIKSAGINFPEWDVESSIKFMDRQNIEAAVVSISAPGIYFRETDFTRKLARHCNEFSADLIKKYPKRFGAFAVLPLPDINASLLELEYALDTLKLDGVGLLSNVDEHYLGDSELNDLYNELNRRNAVVFVHPNTPPKEKLPNTKVPPAVMEFVFDTTRAVANLVYNQTLKKFPNIRFIFPHAGGAVPFLTWRISFGEKRVIKYLKRLYYDLALSSTPYSLRSLQELADPSHILFGSDYPFLPEPLTSILIKEFEKYDGFDLQQHRAIERDNILALFPRFKLD